MTQFEMRFANLAHHVEWLVPTKGERIRRFIDDLNYSLCYRLAQEAKTDARFDQVVEIARPLEPAQKAHQVPCGVLASHHSSSTCPVQLCLCAFPVQRIDLLSTCHAILDYHAKIITLAVPEVPRLEWRGSLDDVPNRAISHLKAQWMVKKMCLAYVTYVSYVSVDTPIVESVLIVRDFPYLFLVYVPGMPHDRGIEFDIDSVPDINPISISSYHMAPINLKELKE
uniref:Uncharacterized protein LOC104243326 n=1 Tax=Nicotiana sylvestris TaxID=4096 RepID=A0A1U7Y4F4_NICSY|nr:PREDICTED: uncharacterized protein LOC104243326 [Nicotiana sylvestris]